MGFYMKKLSLLGLGAGLLAAFSFTAVPAMAESTLEMVKKAWSSSVSGWTTRTWFL